MLLLQHTVYILLYTFVLSSLTFHTYFSVVKLPIPQALTSGHIAYVLGFMNLVSLNISFLLFILLALPQAPLSFFTLTHAFGS